MCVFRCVLNVRFSLTMDGMKQTIKMEESNSNVCVETPFNWNDKFVYVPFFAAIYEDDAFISCEFNVCEC